MANSSLFGPVPSRRLGLSLGIDCVPHKTCSLNCVYCECGETTELTLERKEYVPTSKIINELDSYLSGQPKLDFITFAGSGEPCLHSGIGQIVTYLKKNYPSYKTALLTNGTLLYLPEVRYELLSIDLVLPSLDAVLPETFNTINRPSPSLQVNQIIDGIITFSKEYTGELWIEVFIIPGINDSEKELNLLKTTLEKISLKKVQLNSLDRPAPVGWIKAASLQQLSEISEFFLPISTEIIARYVSESADTIESSKIEDQILRLVQRRPCTSQDLASSTGTLLSELHKILSLMESRNLIVKDKVGDNYFYKRSDAN